MKRPANDAVKPFAGHFHILYNHPENIFYFATTVCTVDLLIPKCLAAARTVALCSMIYSPRITARSSVSAFDTNFIMAHSNANVCCNIYMLEVRGK